MRSLEKRLRVSRARVKTLSAGKLMPGLEGSVSHEQIL